MSSPHTRLYLRIGQIASRSGVSAKALRLYEKRGLLKPCTYSDAGYRLYGPAAMQQLMQVLVLRRSGFSLAEIASLQARGDRRVAGLLTERITILEREVREKAQALATLRRVADRMATTSTPTIDQLLESIRMTSTLDIHIPAAQRQQLHERADRMGAAVGDGEASRLHQRIDARLDQLGATGLEAAQQPWRELSADIRAAMAAGVLAADTRAAALATRWQVQVSTFLATDPQFLVKLRDLYTRHPDLMVEQSMSPAMMDYMQAAMAAAGWSLPA